MKFLTSFPPLFLMILFTQMRSATAELKSPALSSCSIFPSPSTWINVKRPEEALPIVSWLKSIIPAINLNSDLMTNSATFDEDYNFQPTSIKGADDLTWMRYGSIYDSRVAGWLVGKFDVNNVTGNNILFVYPDFFTAIVGRFQDEVLQQGWDTVIKAYRCRGGVLELEFEDVSPENPPIKYEESSETFVTSNPLIRDGYERRYLYVGKTRLGLDFEGLFAKRAIPPNQLVALYAGFRVHDTKAIYWENMTDHEQELVHMNLMSFDQNYSLNLPPPHDQLQVYRATLAHKTNHRFEGFNVDFDYFRSPRFGFIRCLRSTRAIERHEELFVNYNYRLDSDLPQWYEQLYENLYGPIEEESDDDP